MGEKNRKARSRKPAKSAVLRSGGAGKAAKAAKAGHDRGERAIRALHELQVHQEELKTQNETLRELQHVLEETRDRYVDLFDFAPVCYVTTDYNGVIQEINLTGAQLFGLKRASLIGRPLFSQVGKPFQRRFLNHLNACVRSEAAIATNLELVASGNDAISVQFISRKVGDRVRTVIQDLTDVRRLEQERHRLADEQQRIEQREAATKATNAAKDRFLAMLSHELRTPLTPVIAAIAGLEPRGDVAPETRTLLSLIQRNIRVETRLIDDLLDVTRIEHGKLSLSFETVEMHDLVSESLDDFARNGDESIDGAQPRIVPELHAPHRHVRGDRVRLRQVLWNLLSNARRHTPAGGTITVRTELDGDGLFSLSVQDTGDGIEPEFIPQLFVPFAQFDRAPKARRGLGLGLSICRGIVDAHGGTIAVTSPGFGRGATFTISLPLAAAADVAAASIPDERAEETPPRRRRPLRILLVEDHADSATALAMYLRMKGFEVDIAGSVDEAVTRAESEPDLLISDLDLPDGSGHDLLIALRKVRPVAALALSGHASSEDVSKSKQAGFDDHLVKPIEMPALLRAIDRATSQEHRNGKAAAPLA